jgi:hypothetical protein
VTNTFASGKWAIAMCDRCGQQFKLKTLKTEIIKTKKYDLLVCQDCWDPDQPQLQLGMYPINDPQALRNSRRDTTYFTSGIVQDGQVSGGSRVIQWGWNPVGFAQSFVSQEDPNNLVANGSVGSVTITTS